MISDHDKRLDGALDALLSSLPRERAGVDFTQRLLIRLDAAQRHPRPQTLRMVALATATAVVAIGLTSLGWHLNQRAYQSEIMAECQAIRQEYYQVSRQHLNYQKDLTQFAVYKLGGDHSVEVVFDLNGIEDIDRLDPDSLSVEAAGRQVNLDVLEIGDPDPKPINTIYLGGAI